MGGFKSQYVAIRMWRGVVALGNASAWEAKPDERDINEAEFIALALLSTHISTMNKHLIFSQLIN